jgi:hypothetical protein
MVKALLIGVILLCAIHGFTQKDYFQQQTDYRIHAVLNDTAHTLKGDISVTYTNNASESLSFIYFHLWMNAFGNKNSAYAQQLLQQGNTKFYFAENETLGGYGDLDFTIDGKKCTVEADKIYPDILKIVLPNPLKTGEKTIISTPFTLKLPYAFSRGGHVGQQYLMTQWYPKPAVYDVQGWHVMPYLDQGEFYADFGNFDVTLALPENYVLGATGVLQTDSEKDFLQKIIKNTEGGMSTDNGQRTADNTPIPSSKNVKTIRFTAENVIDFAWFADKNFKVLHSQATLKSGKKVDTYAYFTPKHNKNWSKAHEYIKRAVEFYSENVGEYPHPHASAVMTDAPFEGGMEYPMITALSGRYDAKSLDGTIAHEVGHNWFQGILATNERDNAWMDEGLNSFYDHQYLEKYYPKTADTVHKDSFGEGGIFQWFLRGSGYTVNDFVLDNLIAKREDQSARLTSDSMTQNNYFLGAYEKPARALKFIETTVGKEHFEALMQGYFKQWQFKHPQPNDFFTLLKSTVSDTAFSSFLTILDKGILPKKLEQGLKPLNLRWAIGINNPAKTNVFWTPVVGANFYDKGMVGLLLHNGTVPFKKWEWALMPLYALESKTLTGISNIQYQTFTPKNHQLTFGTEVKRFGYKKNLAYTRFMPSVNIEFWKRPLSHYVQSLKIRHSFLNEEEVFKDSLERLSIKNKWSNGTEFSYSGHFKRTLAPTSFRLSVEKYSYSMLDRKYSFLKTSLEFQQEYMFKEDRKFSARLFVGGFPLNSGRKSGLGFTRGFLGLSARGFSDYRYDDFYMGRNEEEGRLSQQINPNTEGGLKFALPKGETTRVGYSNNFIAALNLKTQLPLKWDIGLKPYFDIGFFSDTRPGGERTKSQWLASGGLAWEYEDYFGIYLPFYFSGVKTDPNSFHCIMTRRDGFLSRMTFSFNLKKLNILQLLKKV